MEQAMGCSSTCLPDARLHSPRSLLVRVARGGAARGVPTQTDGRAPGVTGGAFATFLFWALGLLNRQSVTHCLEYYLIAPAPRDKLTSRPEDVILVEKKGD